MTHVNIEGTRLFFSIFLFLFLKNCLGFDFAVLSFTICGWGGEESGKVENE